jgi:hypothetical protein
MSYGQQKDVAHNSPTLLSLSTTGYTGSISKFSEILSRQRGPLQVSIMLSPDQVSSKVE